MKKTYIQPEMKVAVLRDGTMLATSTSSYGGSGNPVNGRTHEENFLDEGLW